MKLRPLADRILVQRSEVPEVTKGGIIRPDSAQEKPQHGTVKAVGPGKLNEDGTRQDMAVSVGDTVLFSSYAGTDVSVEGDDYLVMRVDDVLAILG